MENYLRPELGRFPPLPSPRCHALPVCIIGPGGPGPPDQQSSWPLSIPRAGGRAMFGARCRRVLALRVVVKWGERALCGSRSKAGSESPKWSIAGEITPN